MSENLSSAAVVIGALMVKGVVQLHSNMNPYAIILKIESPPAFVEDRFLEPLSYNICSAYPSSEFAVANT